MADDPIVFAAELFTSIGVTLAAIIFARLAFKSKSLGSFQFQLSIFVLIWVAAELPHIASTLGIIDDTSYQTLGLAFHFISMAAFALFVGARSFQFLGAHPKPQPSPPHFPQTSLSPTKHPGAPEK
ncbi:MAG TPA: hypothetical protein VGS11_02605 [Candidatus Bathyarchaeia archaeon]|nr:hypothetical protein [Candidatus Bathyarchaeia archaeon]